VNVSPLQPRLAPPAGGRALGLMILVLAAGCVPASLLCDFSWESTVGIDQFWSPAHTFTYAAVGLTCLGSVVWTGVAWRSSTRYFFDVPIQGVRVPLGTWLILWGGVAFVTALIFDGWWQAAYGLGAGIWHPPQLLKTAAFFAMLGGVWLLCLANQNLAPHPRMPLAATLFSVAGGFLLVLITIIRLTSSYPNQQHSASFHQFACATYPVLLAALARAGRLRLSATAAAAAYAGLICVLIWLLPLIPAKPEVGPIYNALNHLMPPPFPLLLIVPALAMDRLAKVYPWTEEPGADWRQAGALAMAFFLFFVCAQWIFAEFLLSDLADNAFFAGAGRHWPFFLKIDASARTRFWNSPRDSMTLSNALLALSLAALATRLGWWLGAWMTRVRR